MLDYPINYVEVTIESIQHQLALAGATPNVQKELGDLLRALGNPDGIYATARIPESITPTTVEQVAAYKLLPKLTC